MTDCLLSDVRVALVQVEQSKQVAGECTVEVELHVTCTPEIAAMLVAATSTQAEACEVTFRKLPYAALDYDAAS